jgi:hypothetical protein
MRQPEWTRDEEASGFLREAEMLMGGQPAVPKE